MNREISLPAPIRDVSSSPLRTSLWDFSFARLPAGVAFTRASTGTYFDSAGVMRTAAINVPRFTYEGVTRTNFSFNSELLVVSGVTPKWMNLQAGNGLTHTVVGTGTDSLGRRYCDVRLRGTNTSAGTYYPYVYFNPQSGNGTTRVNAGQVWTFSVDARVIAGSYDGLNTNGPSVGIRVVDSTGGYIGESTGTRITSGRQSKTWTMQTNSNQATGVLQMSMAPGATVDITIRVKQPQLELSAVATGYISSPLDAVGNAPTYSGLLVEKSQYNFAPLMVPTTISTASITTGIDDPAGTNTAIRFNLTGGNDPISSQTINTSPAGRTFTRSMYFRDCAMYGQASNFNSFEYGVTGTESVSSQVFITGTAWKRYSVTRTFPAVMNSTQISMRVDPFDNGTNAPVAGSSQDTAFWQYEEGSRMTSYIPPNSGRSADMLSLAVPNGNYNMVYTFDDGSTQTIAATITDGIYTVPTASLGKYIIKRIQAL